ncbi:MAG: diacylglycerol kinase [Peptococcaceae bacterium BRH_c4b]|nr:MAG: diacylglycerol kinase [Peptococcaceae bacterium BRH_c4b]
MRYFFILNPGSGGGKSRNNFKRIFAILDHENINYEFKLTSSLEDAYAISLEANKKGCDVIVAVGGDGTINRVLNGFYDALGRRISSSKLAVIYTGTSPDFCKSYNIPLKIDHAVNMLLTGKSKKIQVGKVTHACFYDQGLDGQPINIKNENVKTSYFACCANIGLGASLARSANSGIRKYIGDYAGTFVALIKTLLNYKACNFTVNFDGQKQVMEKVFNIAVGRTTFIASGIKVKNDLSPGDSRFYNLIVKNMRFTDWLGVVRKVYSGKEFVNNDIISLQYAKFIEVHGSSGNPELEFDGDPRGFLPCLIETAQDPLDLICEVYYE